MASKIKDEKHPSLPKKRSTTEDDALWLFATKNVTPLHPDSPDNKTRVHEQTTNLGPGQPERKTRQEKNENLIENQQIKRRHTDGRTDEKLRRGKIAIQDRIDLHGHTREQAQKTLIRFLLRCHDHDIRCVLVITGKGRKTGETEEGVLRRHVPIWLTMPPLNDLVLAIHPARIRDGGSGAFYILLRRKK